MPGNAEFHDEVVAEVGTGWESPLAVALLARHAATSKRIAARLEEGGIRIAAVARDAEELSDRLEGGAPDVIVHCCAAAPTDTKRELLALKRRFFKPPIVAVVRSRDADALARAALEANVEGVVYSARVSEALVPTVHAVGADQVVLPQSAYRRAVPVVLSQRERQVLRLAVEGLTNDSIAKTLYISCSTVKSHLTSAFAKLSVRSRSEAAVILLNPDEPASRLVFSDVAGDAERPGVAVEVR